MTTEQRYIEFKEDHLKYVTAYIKRNGELGSLITVLAEQYEDKPPMDAENDPNKEKSVVIQIPVPGEFLKDREAKDNFVDKVIPTIFNDIKKKFNPKAVAWTAEAWMREASNEEYEKTADFTELPISGEVVVVSFTKDGNFEETFIYRIQRNGKVVNGEGEMIDDINLIEDKKLSSNAEDEDKGTSGEGRFMNLFAKFNS